MTAEELTREIDVPTLHSVIETGDEGVIQTKRIGNEIGLEIDGNLGTDLSQEIIQDLAQRTLAPESSHAADEPLELLIDDIVDRHITALRQDIRLLLERALAQSQSDQQNPL